MKLESCIDVSFDRVSPPAANSYVGIETSLRIIGPVVAVESSGLMTPDNTRLLEFATEGIPGIEDISIEMDLHGRLTANHADPIPILKAVIRWCAARPLDDRFRFMAAETMARLLLSHLIVQREF